MKITRTIEGKEYEFELTMKEIQAVRDEDTIANAMNFLEMHEESITKASFNKTMKSRLKLLKIGTDLANALYDDNADAEWALLERSVEVKKFA